MRGNVSGTVRAAPFVSSSVRRAVVTSPCGGERNGDAAIGEHDQALGADVSLHTNFAEAVFVVEDAVGVLPVDLGWSGGRARALHRERALPRREHHARRVEAAEEHELPAHGIVGVDVGLSARLAAHETERALRVGPMERDTVAARRKERVRAWHGLEQRAVVETNTRQGAVARDDGDPVGEGPPVFDGGNERPRTEGTHLGGLRVRAVVVVVRLGLLHLRRLGSAGRRACGGGREAHGLAPFAQLVEHVRAPLLDARDHEGARGVHGDRLRVDAELELLPGGASVLRGDEPHQVGDGRRAPAVACAVRDDLRAGREGADVLRGAGARVDRDVPRGRAHVHAIETHEHTGDGALRGEHRYGLGEPGVGAEQRAAHHVQVAATET
jgi:hypothetical protein